MKGAGLAFLQEEVEVVQSHLSSADETGPSFLIASRGVFRKNKKEVD